MTPIPNPLTIGSETMSEFETKAVNAIIDFCAGDWQSEVNREAEARKQFGDSVTIDMPLKVVPYTTDSGNEKIRLDDGSKYPLSLSAERLRMLTDKNVVAFLTARLKQLGG